VKKHSKAIGAAAAILWIVFWITAVILQIAGDGRLMETEMMRCAPPETTGLAAAEYPGVVDMTAGYLTGRIPEFQYTVTDSAGQNAPCFHDYEAAHMADCRALISLDRTVMILAGVSALALTAAALLRGNRERFCRGILTGLRIMGGVLAVLLIWALADFTGLFVTFHKAAFPNGGWVLNLQTDLLIRLMPTEFFIRLGLRGLLRFIALPVILAVCAHIVRKVNRDQKKVLEE
jgi:Predicted membrane protein